MKLFGKCWWHNWKLWGEPEIGTCWESFHEEGKIIKEKSCQIQARKCKTCGIIRLRRVYESA